MLFLRWQIHFAKKVNKFSKPFKIQRNIKANGHKPNHHNVKPIGIPHGVKHIFFGREEM